MAMVKETGWREKFLAMTAEKGYPFIKNGLISISNNIVMVLDHRLPPCNILKPVGCKNSTHRYFPKRI
jgi:hypothetical protein